MDEGHNYGLCGHVCGAVRARDGHICEDRPVRRLRDVEGQLPLSREKASLEVECDRRRHAGSAMDTVRLAAQVQQLRSRERLAVHRPRHQRLEISVRRGQR